MITDCFDNRSKVMMELFAEKTFTADDTRSRTFLFGGVRRRPVCFFGEQFL